LHFKRAHGYLNVHFCGIVFSTRVFDEDVDFVEAASDAVWCGRAVYDVCEVVCEVRGVEGEFVVYGMVRFGACVLKIDWKLLDKEG
jgi:hypothetical protein